MINTKVKVIGRPKTDFPQNLDIFKVEQETLNQIDLKKDEILVKVLYVSIDAAMRIWLNGGFSYMQGVELGDVMTAFGIGQVVQSNSNKYKVGTKVSGLLGWQNYTVVNAKTVIPIDPNYQNPTHFISAMGISGMTAYFGLYDICKLKSTDIVLISSAAGGVGEYAVQLAKMQGCRVIGVAGGKDKCDHVVKNLKADDCIDYKEGNFAKKLKQLCPKGVDVYFDNVGGEMLDAVLAQLKDGARIACCGAISGYNTKQIYGINNYFNLIPRRALMKGFIYTDYLKEVPQVQQQFIKLLNEGKMVATEDRIYGIQNAPLGLQRLLQGKNIGKVIIFADEQSKPKL